MKKYEVINNVKVAMALTGEKEKVDWADIISKNKDMAAKMRFLSHKGFHGQPLGKLEGWNIKITTLKEEYTYNLITGDFYGTAFDVNGCSELSAKYYYQDAVKEYTKELKLSVEILPSTLIRANDDIGLLYRDDETNKVYRLVHFIAPICDGYSYWLCDDVSDTFMGKAYLEYDKINRHEGHHEECLIRDIRPDESLTTELNKGLMKELSLS